MINVSYYKFFCSWISYIDIFFVDSIGRLSLNILFNFIDFWLLYVMYIVKFIDGFFFLFSIVVFVFML